ncbi:hypothetical protein LTR08_005288 [Meristemomyces frigidus]|nr:hypothetical protein LTR08_005288 [Meristemomyces frigidus]
MAAALPAKLKAADCQRFATRAAQLEKYRPIVTYWCEYYILQRILTTHLHTTDPDSQTYAIQLMDKLEATKAAQPLNDCITDDVAAKAYIENFALETFERGDAEQRAGKVTRQTADTFQAAGTFVDLLGIWGEVGEEAARKGRFAKFHALRIARAVKAGEDPNGSNPVVEEVVQPDGGVGEEGIERELRNLQRQESSGGYQAPTVETAPDDVQTPREGSAAPPPPPAALTTDPDVSPLESAGKNAARQASLGGGYFPSVPDAVGANADADADVPDPDEMEISLLPHQQPPSAPLAFNPADFYNTSQPAVAPPPGAHSPNPLHFPSHPPPPPAPYQPAPAPYQLPPTPHHPQPPPAPLHPHSQPAARMEDPSLYRTDDESVLAAQKHAKWAISALNFEDVGTAVKELRLALGRLGAS